MKKTSRILGIGAVLALGATGCGSLTGGEEEFPTQEITFIIPYGPGGSMDPLGRQFAETLGEELGTQVTVLNREGGGSAVGTTEITQASADGYTIGLCVDSAVALIPQQQDVPYSRSDVDLLAGFVSQPANLAVGAHTPWESLEDFVQYVGDNPGEVQIGNSGANSVTDLEVQKLSDALDADVQSIDFAGGGEAMTALLGGRVDGVIGRGPTFESANNSGDIRVLGTYNDETYDFMPDATPFSELGVDMPETPEIVGVCAPSDLPEEIRDVLTEASETAASSSSFVQFLEESGYISRPMDSGEYNALMDEYEQIYADLLDS